MKISARPLKGEAFELEVDPADSVEVLKVKLGQSQPELAAGSMKIIFSGKVLADGQTLQDSGVKEGDFIVVMPTKAKPAEPAVASSAAAAPAAATPAPMVPAASSAAAPAPAPAVSPAADLMAAGASSQDAGMESAVQMLCDMGFPRSEVERCLRAAFGNPDRAVEYLMSGIPQAVLQQQAAAAAGAPPPAPAPVPAAAPAAMPGAPGLPGAGAATSPFPQPGAAPSGPGGPLAALRSHPRFGQLRMVVQQSPQVLNQVLSAIAQSDPSLITLIAEHQEEFVEMLQEPVGLPDMRLPLQAGHPAAQPAAGPATGPAPSAPAQPPTDSGPLPQDPIAAMLAAAQAAQAGQAGGTAPIAPPMVPGLPQPAAGAPASAPAAPAISLTPAEQEAVGRLQALGFERMAAVEAFLACDRNEELAANYLFESAED